MTNIKNETTDAAWAKLQAALSQETENPQWKQWAEEGAAVQAPMAVLDGQTPSLTIPASVDAVNADPLVTKGLPLPLPSLMETGKLKRTGTFDSWIRRNNKRIGIATAAFLLVAVIATPLGNEALASILGKFRMQQVTVVNENELQQLFYNATNGESRETINKFGTFSQVSGKITGEFTAAEAAKQLKRPIVMPKGLNENDQKLYISPSNAITFKINVDEVNATMARLGATKLLPQSVNGKAITLELGEAANIYTEKKDQPGYSFTQQPVPVVVVDPSISVAEAFDAVMQFPLLPDGLKQSLEQSNVLKGGAIPLPVFSNGQSEKMKLGNVDTIVTSRGSGASIYYSVTWVKDEQLFTLSGNEDVFPSRQALLDQTAELIKQ
ncbi:hypothetical protein [Paenibacillus agricola]|uniref:DUF4367 domain-containing protein n=1 Tax=Paenibacillus agricola TaxID=2716264 RepID=A0ABX0JB30_9BACL|nr:hypothetical protein [Paenibacillus agricola]NHN30945.1 hypothetical protein [Paenibacillus agricola]